MKNKKIANINIKFKQLMVVWLELTKTFHKMPPREINITALLLYHYFRLRKVITNDKILWNQVFDYDTKMIIQEELDISNQAIQNALTSLRKKGVIQNNRIVETYIPNIEDNSNNFEVTFNFRIVDNG